MKVDLNDPKEFTPDNIRRLIASGDDRRNTQLRVSKDGLAYISNVVGNDQTDDVAVRMETFSAESGNVGEVASQNDDWIEQVYRALRKNWPNPPSVYIVFF